MTLGTRGIFKLSDVMYLTDLNLWSTVVDVWVAPSPTLATPPNFGYFGGGAPGPSLVDRIDYANDTATAAVKGPLSLSRSYLAATSQNVSFV